MKYGVADTYDLNLYCTCLSCKNKTSDLAKSCKIYHKERGIPPEIWNGKNAKCEHYIDERSSR